MMEKTIFARIIDRELPAEIVFEDEDIICIKDKFPQASVHILLIAKKKIPSLQQLEEDDYPIIVKIVDRAKHLAREFGVEDNYRFLTNCGTKAGQSVFHLHFHLIGGKVSGSKGG